MPLTEEERAEVARLVAAQGDARKWFDAAFAHAPASLAQEDRGAVAGWRRPRRIAKKPPSLFVRGASLHDVEQGSIGDCWFLAAATAVAQYPDLIRKVIPEGQPLHGDNYRGVIVCRFWRMGHWVSVYIDDKLPVDEDGALVYGRCTAENEFWLPLLEKAFAKFHGNYENIVAGFPSEAFLSLTGFVVEEANLGDCDGDVRQLHRLFVAELKNDSIIACATESRGRKGLVSDHAYTVTGAGRVRLPGGGGLVRLVRVRNPHASAEWEGAWADADPIWNEIDGETLKKLGYKNKDDGQFWIKMSHFKKHFPEVYLAARLPDFGDTYETTTRQSFVVTHFWKTGFNAGGADVNSPKFLTNPQYTLIVNETDDPESDCEEDKEDDTDENKTCDVVIELIQEQDRAKYQELDAIGITIFKVGEAAAETAPRRLTPRLLDGLRPHAGSREHAPCSTAVTRVRMRPGAYALVPCTKEPDTSRRFLLRLYSRKPVTFLT